MSKGMDCPLCGQKDAKFITRDLRFEKNADVYECLQCELVFLDQNSFQLPAGFYENEYHQSYLTHVEPDALDPKAYFEKMLKVAAPWALANIGTLLAIRWQSCHRRVGHDRPGSRNCATTPDRASNGPLISLDPPAAAR